MLAPCLGGKIALLFLVQGAGWRGMGKAPFSKGNLCPAFRKGREVTSVQKNMPKRRILEWPYSDPLNNDDCGCDTLWKESIMVG